MTALFDASAINIGTTGYCINVAYNSFGAAAGFTPLIHDTIVFFAISWRILMNSSADHGVSSLYEVFTTGKHLPALSRALLKDGQLYYLCAFNASLATFAGRAHVILTRLTVGSNLLTVMFFYIRSLRGTYQTMLTGPNVVLTNIMACYVFRKLKLGLFEDDSISSSFIMSQIALALAPLTASRQELANEMARV